MQWNWRDEWWKPATAFILGTLVSYVAFAIIADAPIDGEKARGWIGALSGWIAAGGALLAAALTLPYLRAQAAQAKRQTDHLIGDGDPEARVVKSKGLFAVDVLITNWNRRTLRIIAIRAVGEGVRIIKVEVPNTLFTQFDSGDFAEDPLHLSGRSLTGEPAPQKTITVTLGADMSTAGDSLPKVPVRFEIDAALIGEVYEPILIKAIDPGAVMFPSKLL